MKLIVNVVLLLLFCGILRIAAAAQTGPTLEDLQKRVAELEGQLKAVKQELSNIKPSAEAVDAANVAPLQPKPAPKSASEPPAKKELGINVGSARITPYGTIFFNAFGNSGGTNNADIPLFATPTGSGNASSSVRQTRLGLRIEGSRVGTARLGAVIEGDFFGGFPSVGIGETFGVVRLRLAYARLDWEKASVTVGQDWMVFAPVNPTSMAAAAIPQMAAAGNIWARLPQFRIERKIGERVTWQGAILAPQTGDFASNAAFFIQPTSGAASRVPFLQSRIMFSDKNWFDTKKPGSIGLSGHYGRSKVFTGMSNIRNDIESVGVALDWNFPLAPRLRLLGEAFFGRNLGGFQSGVFQSYNNDFAYRTGTSVVAGGVRSIGTHGGWIQAEFTLPVLDNRFGIYASVGIDDPSDRDLTSVSRREWRTRNLAMAANVVYKFTPQFSVGTEIRRFHTFYLLAGPQSVNHVNLGAAYTF